MYPFVCVSLIIVSYYDQPVLLLFALEIIFFLFELPQFSKCG